MTLPPTDDQNKAIKEIVKWYKNPNSNQEFVLFGYAGVGKTHILPYIADDIGYSAEDYPNVQTATYTAKAASVARRKGMTNCRTIHSLIYKHERDKKTGKVTWKFNNESPLRAAKILIVDEVSFVNEKIRNDLLKFGKKILVVGDPGQLKPPEGQSAYLHRKPDFFLSEVVRQALDNPILLFATAARMMLPFPDGTFDTVRIANPEDITVEELINVGQIIVGKHATRHIINSQCLEYMGFNDTFPLQGNLKLKCTKNNSALGIYNGQMVATLGHGRQINEYELELDLMDDDEQLYKDLKVSTGPFLDYKRTPKKYIDMTGKERFAYENFGQFDFGYAITTHSFQGSEAEDGIIVDDGMCIWNKEDRARFLYTALTRFSERLTYVKTF